MEPILTSSEGHSRLYLLLFLAQHPPTHRNLRALDVAVPSKKYTKRRCCYIIVDSAMAQSLNCVCKTQQVCHVMILFYDCTMIKDKLNNLKFLKNIGFLMKRKLINSKSIL
jgi:hypothetical protein